MFNKKFSNKVRSWFGSDTAKSGVVIPRKQHGLSRKKISSNALKVLYRLKKTGFSAYLVGGGVRDVLLGLKTKDYDIATNATPGDLRRLFINSRIIGRRFRLVHVYFPKEIIEVSTFRADTSGEVVDETEMIRSDNTFGTIEEDAWRRDFTVNAMYYNIFDFSIVDFAGGMADLKRRLLRIIGDPESRFHEDPVRLLRALRFAAKLDFTLEEATAAAVRALPHLLEHVPTSRILHEFEKLFFQGHAYLTYNTLVEYQYFSILFPTTSRLLAANDAELNRKLLALALKVTDERFATGQSLNPGFLIGVFLWPVFRHYMAEEMANKKPFHKVLHSVMQRVVFEQRDHMAIPKRYVGIIHSVWLLQFYFEKRRPKRVLFILQHRYFRAAIDMLQLRVQAGEPLQALLSWWQKINGCKPGQRLEMIDQLRGQQAPPVESDKA